MYTAKLDVGQLARSLCSAGYAGFSGAVSEGRGPSQRCLLRPSMSVGDQCQPDYAPGEMRSTSLGEAYAFSYMALGGECVFL